jgi:predicted ATPase with chaperone activity
MLFLAELSLDGSLHHTQASSPCLVWPKIRESPQFLYLSLMGKEAYLIIGVAIIWVSSLSQPVGHSVG